MRALQKRWALPLTGLALSAATLLLVSILLVGNRRDTETAVGKELQAIAAGVAPEIPAKSYASLFYQSGKLRPDLRQASRENAFAQIKEILREGTARYNYLNLGKDNLYSFVIDPASGELFWAVMLHETAFTGEKYVPPAVVKTLLASKSPGFSPVYLSTASQREWISGYAPIMLEGQVIGLVEVAREVTEVLKAARGSLYPAIGVSIGIILISGGAMFLILQFARRLQKSNSELSDTLGRLTASTAVSRHLTESSSDIVFGLDSDMKIVSLNSAARRQLGIDPTAATGKDLTGTLCTRKDGGADYLFDPELLQQALLNLRETGEKVNLTATLTSRLTGEPKDYRIRVERVSQAQELQFIGRASSLGDMVVAPLLNRTRLAFTLNNSLLMTEELATFLSGLCRRYVDEQKVTTYRIMLREMLLNAIEHGNLEIDFDTKTHALMTESYFELINERRRTEPYRNRVVTVDCLIDAQKIAFRITDEGKGFDHRSMIAKLRDERNETAHGRGIVMTLQEFDKVRYNEKGNSVVLVKYLAGS
ncbi:MAG TPA: ATP-binding protein [Turneriella sp.]|nr:ATP-binding protein [Turneriella sp.]HNN00504.1 ATP-binding protein [Turneriella sp.]